MTRASAFTAIPGWGGVAMGVTAVAAAAVSGPPDNSLRWVMVWFVEAVVAVAIALPTMTWKARRSGTPLSTTGPAYPVPLAHIPPLLPRMVPTPGVPTLRLAARPPGCRRALV